MANITKYLVTGRRPELAPAAAAALAPPHPWEPAQPWPAPLTQLNPRARFRELLGRRRPISDTDRLHGLQGLLGEVAWRHLPAAVRERFSEPTRHVDYIGEFDIVRASLLGRAIAWFCTLIGTPVVPRTGQGVGAVIHVGPVDRGASWLREYQWPNGKVCRVHSTKVIGADGILVEELPAGLRMPLDVFERHGVLHFFSLGYYFDLGLRLGQHALKIPLPHWLSPGTTHVEHADETDGWFRFTMTVTHPLFGELFYQTGRFRAAGCGALRRTDESREASPRIDPEQTNVGAMRDAS